MSPSVAGVSGDFDLAVVGGGALGCAVAWEGATRGVRVVLLEQDDFGSGASANSLKIVHGGLRYLQKMDIRRARASAFERSVFLRIAPNLVRPLECMLPTRRSLLRGRVAMAGGLAMNALVTFDRNLGLSPESRLRAGGLVSLATLAKAAPALNLEGVTGGARWFDAQMIDSERLALAFALGAEIHGAVLLNHHRVTEFSNEKGRITGVVAEDALTGNRSEIAASVVADCRCAWSSPDGVPPGPANAPPFIKATNIILPGTDLKCALGFPMRDDSGKVIPGRMLFATPWNGVTVVGTWYNRDSRGPGAGVTKAELYGMLNAVNASYGGWGFKPGDVRAIHVGFLPAIPDCVSGDGEPVPMDKPMCQPAIAAGGADGLWFLQTEKWTTVRRLAQHFVDRLAVEGVLHASRSETSWRPLPGATTKEKHGTEIVPGTDGVLVGELMHAIEREHASTLGDLLRRTGIGSNGRPDPGVLASIAAVAAGPLSWTEKEQQRQIDDVCSWPQYRTSVISE